MSLKDGDHSSIDCKKVGLKGSTSFIDSQNNSILNLNYITVANEDNFADDGVDAVRPPLPNISPKNF